MKNIFRLFKITVIMAALGFTISGCLTASSSDPLPNVSLDELVKTNSSASENAKPPAGIVVEGAGLAEKLAWLDKNAEKDNTYVIILDKDENIPPYTFGGKDRTIILWGRGEPRNIGLTKTGHLFTIARAGIKLVLDRNIILRGRDDNSRQVIELTKGTVEMNEGSAITGNCGGAVYINKDGRFVMNGGAIAGNVISGMSGSVQVAGTFIMMGGSIFKNAGHGVGLYKGALSMSGGSIYDNSRYGVSIYRDSSKSKYGIVGLLSDVASSIGDKTGFSMEKPATRASIHGNKSGQVNAPFIEDGVIQKEGY